MMLFFFHPLATDMLDFQFKYMGIGGVAIHVCLQVVVRRKIFCTKLPQNVILASGIADGLYPTETHHTVDMEPPAVRFFPCFT